MKKTKKNDQLHQLLGELNLLRSDLMYLEDKRDNLQSQILDVKLDIDMVERKIRRIEEETEEYI